MPTDVSGAAPNRAPDGTLEERDGRHLLRFERRLAHPVPRVWAALTEPAELAGWLAAADIDLQVGGQVELRWLNNDDQGNRAVARGTITRLEPPRLLEIDTDIHGRLRWELREDGRGCVLTFTSSVALPANYRAMVLAGWHVHLDHLTAALAGRPVDWPTWTEDHWGPWSEHRDRYAAALDRHPLPTAGA